jgi:hypothetical protein
MTAQMVKGFWTKMALAARAAGFIPAVWQWLNAT